MKQQFKFGLAILLLTTTALPAHAQYRGGREGGGRSLTLFTGVDYRGQSVTITEDIAHLARINFDEAAGSLIARGQWQVCLDPNYGSRCRTYQDRVPNLESFRGRISSVRYLGDRGRDRFDDRNDKDRLPQPYQGQVTSGRSNVFYPGRVQVGSNWGQPPTADDFCRIQGHRDAAYFSRDRDGDLEDVLCRRK
ncbi:MAG: hypothetical protein RL186_185 [Pseudomonadota bacterium]